MINRKNYEIWFLDFAEGNLSEWQIALLMEFLAQNVDLKAEFDALEMIKLPADDTLVFENKEKLKRPLTVEFSLTNDDKLLIAQLEGDLNAPDNQLLKQRLSEHPSLIKAQKIYQKSQLAPDLSVKYPNKDELKRKNRKISPWRLLMPIAAAIVLLIVIVFALRKGEAVESVEMPIVKMTNHQTPAPISKEPSQEPIMSDEVVEVPKPIIEQTIVQTPKEQSSKPKKNIVQKKEITPDYKPTEVIVNEEPKSPKLQSPLMQSPPKPQLVPELPESKPVIVLKESSNQTPKPTFVHQENQPTKRMIAMNKPKEFLLNSVDKTIKKIAKKEDVKERLSVPEAIVSTVGAITKTTTSYENRTTKKSKKISVSFGKIKFSRVKHRSR